MSNLSRCCSQMVKESPVAEPAVPVHLFVLHHGLWGRPQSVAELERLMHAQLGGPTSTVKVLNSKVNEHSKGHLTYEGIDQCGIRLAADVVRTVHSLETADRPVTKISFVSYSLGGLIARYAAGLLFSAGWLAQPSDHAQQAPNNESLISRSGSPGPASPSATFHAPTTHAAHLQNPGARTHADVRVAVDDFGGGAGRSQLEKAAPPLPLPEQTARAAAAAPVLGQNSRAPGAAAAGTVIAGANEAALPPRAVPLEAVCFISVATPHLGSWRMPSSVFASCFNSMVPALASKSGLQLMLADSFYKGQPLLATLCDPALPFYTALSAFKCRALFANVYNDRMVPYCTAALERENRFEKCCPQPISADYPSVVGHTKHGCSMSTHSNSRRMHQDTILHEKSSCKGRECTGTAGEQAAGRGGQKQEGVPGAPTNLSGPGAVGGVLHQEGGQLHAGHHQGGSDGALLARSEAPSTLLSAKKPRPRFRGLGGRLLLCLLLPLVWPLILGVIIYFFVVGRQHAAKARLVGPDLSWASTAFVGRNSTQQQQQQQQQQVQSQAAQPMGGSPVASGDRSMPHVVLVQDVAGAAGTDGEGEEREGPCRQATGSGDVDVLFDNDSQMHVREGIVVDDSPVSHFQHEQQIKMCDQLNELGWEKVSVDTRHYHAHAAIILREPSRFRENADCLQYLIDKCIVPYC